MILPRQKELLSLDYVSRGLPIVQAVNTSDIDVSTLDYVSRGMAFLSNNYSTLVKTINGVAIEVIKTINKIPLSSVKTWNKIP